MLFHISGCLSPARSAFVILSLSVFVSGCGGGNSKDSDKGQTKPRVKASGMVQVDGKPLADGVISFSAKDTGNSATAVIKNGSFACSAGAGPNSGDNSIVIMSKESATGPAVLIWTTKVEIPAAGLTAGDFSLDSKDGKPAPKPNPEI